MQKSADSFIPEVVTIIPEPKKGVSYVYLEVPVSRIRPSRKNPRTWFDPETIEGLSASISTQGQISPITVEAIYGDLDYDYEIIDGGRRFAAVLVSGIEVLGVNVRQSSFGSDLERFVFAVSANNNREGLIPMDSISTPHACIGENSVMLGSNVR